MAESGYIQAGQHQLHYICDGNGKHMVIAFPGYSNEAEVCSFIRHPQATVVCMDLPFHGRSFCEVPHAITKAELADAILGLKERFGADRISIVGYSIGGRLALSLVEQLASQLSKVILLAPDGLAPNYFYLFLMRTRLGRSGFRNFLQHADTYISFFAGLRRLRLISKAKYTFAMQHISSVTSRDFLAKVWQSSALLIPDVRKIGIVHRQYPLSIQLFMGKYDKIIKPAKAVRFKRRVPQAGITLLEKGHALLQYKDVQDLVNRSLFG